MSPRARPAGPDPTRTRRALLRDGACLAALLLWPLGVSRPVRAAEEGSALDRALDESPLVYLSPLRGDGSESRCHGEVWFVRDGDDVLVVTSSERWRAEAIRQGLDRARLWVGDHGVWTRAKGAWTSSPSADYRGRLDDAPTTRAQALAAFGAKYSDEWGKWGPRFRKGLADGSRVLLRYTPLEA